MEQHKHQELHKEQEKRQTATFRRYRPTTIQELYGGRCTFCGQPLDPGAAFCMECGNAVKGIPCPKCGTLSFRNFCSNCNFPLTEQAQEALAEAKNDPHFRRAEQLARQMAELEQIIEGRDLKGRGTSEEVREEKPDESIRLTDEERRVLASYSELFSTPIVAPKPSVPTSHAVPTKKRLTKEEALAAYKAKAAELQAEMDAMMPPSAATPEEQRNFFSARKITVVELTLKPMSWVCNYCGCTHRQPSECVEPELGGKWIFGHVETTVERDLID